MWIFQGSWVSFFNLTLLHVVHFPLPHHYFIMWWAFHGCSLLTTCLDNQQGKISRVLPTVCSGHVSRSVQLFHFKHVARAHKLPMKVVRSKLVTGVRLEISPASLSWATIYSPHLKNLFRNKRTQRGRMTVGLNVRQLAGISIPKDLYKWGQVVVLVLENLCPFFSRSDVWRLQKRLTRLLLAHGVTCQVCLRSWIYCSPLQPKGALLKYKSQLILGWKLYCSVCYVF